MRGFAVVEILVFAVVVAIVGVFGFFVVHSVVTEPTSRVCATEAAGFQKAVDSYQRKHHKLPTPPPKPVRQGMPGIAATLVLKRELVDPVLYHNGPGIRQWTYDDQTGKVTPGSACR